MGVNEDLLFVKRTNSRIPKVAILWLRKRIRPQKMSQTTAMPKSSFLESGGHFWKNGLLFWAICGKLFSRLCSGGKSYGSYACFERYRCVNGVAVRDGELILWGTKAMP